jgi:hypothetical protein
MTPLQVRIEMQLLSSYEVDTRDPRDFLVTTLERMIVRQARDLGVRTVHPMFLTLSHNTTLFLTSISTTHLEGYTLIHTSTPVPPLARLPPL